jgi:hypothetical protein
MNTQHLATFVALLALVLSTEDIVPLEAGSVTVEDKFIRRNTCISRYFDLQLTREQYEQQGDISVVAALSELNLDDQLTFQFTYHLNCLKTRCVFELQLERFTREVNPLRDYTLTIDFLVARGMRVLDVNMTYFKQTVMALEKKSYARVVLIPNGFSDVALPGSVEVAQLASNNFLLSYSDPRGLENAQSSMGWTLNRKFVLYKLVFLPHSYKVSNSPNSLFSGFSSTKDKAVKSKLSLNARTLEIQVD